MQLSIATVYFLALHGDSEARKLLGSTYSVGSFFAFRSTVCAA